jgi:hypothetical protein
MPTAGITSPIAGPGALGSHRWCEFTITASGESAAGPVGPGRPVPGRRCQGLSSMITNTT